MLNVKPMVESQNISGLKYPGSKAIYDENNQQIEKWSEIIRLAAGKGTPICLILPKSLLSFFLYFATDSGRESFFLPLPMWWVAKIIEVFVALNTFCSFFLVAERFPFDVNCLTGYCGAIALEYVMTGYIFLFVGSITSFGVGAFLFLLSGCRDVLSNLHLINKMAKSKRLRAKSMQHVFAFIRLHSKMKQLCEFLIQNFRSQNLSVVIENVDICFRLVKNFSNFWQPIFMTLFPWSLVNVCGTSLMIQIELVSYFCLFITNLISNLVLIRKIILNSSQFL